MKHPDGSYCWDPTVHERATALLQKIEEEQAFRDSTRLPDFSVILKYWQEDDPPVLIRMRHELLDEVREKLQKLMARYDPHSPIQRLPADRKQFTLFGVKVERHWMLGVDLLVHWRSGRMSFLSLED